MIRIDFIDSIPELDWTEWAAQEMALGFRDKIERHTSEMVLVSRDDVPILVAGLQRRSLINAPWLWFLMTQAFEKNLLGNIRVCARIALKLEPTETPINVKFEKGCKFAKLFGWRPTQEFVMDGAYQMFRKA